MKIAVLGTGFGAYHAELYKKIPEVETENSLCILPCFCDRSFYQNMFAGMECLDRVMFVKVVRKAYMRHHPGGGIWIVRISALI